MNLTAAQQAGLTDGWDLSGQIALVTGGTAGIGKAIATGLASLGASVIVVGRDSQSGQEAVRQIASDADVDTGDVEFRVADLSSMAEIRSLAESVRANYDQLDVLVNNVGSLNPERRETVDGIEMTFAVNVLGPFLLTEELRPLLEASAPARIVNVNAGEMPFVSLDFDDLEAQESYSGMRVYGRSKLANRLWTAELARRLDGSEVTVNAVNPGGADTPMSRKGINAMPWIVRALFPLSQKVLPDKYVPSGSPEDAAWSAIYAAASPEMAERTGLYLDPEATVEKSLIETMDAKKREQLWNALENRLNSSSSDGATVIG